MYQCSAASQQTANSNLQPLPVLNPGSCCVGTYRQQGYATHLPRGTNQVTKALNCLIYSPLPKKSEATISCDGGKSVSTDLPMRAILNIDLGCELRADSFHIDRISFRHLASKESRVDSKFNFKITADISKIAGKLNLHIHNVTDDNRPDLDNLMQNNKDIKQELKRTHELLQFVIGQGNGGSTELEQVAVWPLLAFLVLTAGFLLYSYIRLHVRLSRNVQNQQTSEEEEALELQIRDLKSRIIELESDYQVRAKK